MDIAAFTLEVPPNVYGSGYGGECSFFGERGRCNFAVWELISGLRVLLDSWGL